MEQEGLGWNEKTCIQKQALPVPGAWQPWPDEAAALANGPSPYLLSLDGAWRFFFAEGVDRLPAACTGPEQNDAGWDTIRVPGNWQLAGYDRPIYTNLRYPYPLHTEQQTLPAIRPQENPVGVYRRSFTLPAAFAGRRCLLQLDGANSAAGVFCNGQFAGYATSSFDAHRFDLTPYLKEGENLLVILVYRYCAGSYLEDQDMWRLSGLFRSVWLVAQPETGIEDVFAATPLGPNLEPGLDVKVTLPAALPAGCMLAVTLTGQEGTVLTQSVPAVAGETRITCPAPGAALWSDETPNLYRLAVTLTEGETVLDARGLAVGFRQVEIAKRPGHSAVLLLNKKPVKLRGVNRHEFWPDTGHAVTRQQNETDIRLMKQNNLNALRTSHYPNSRDVYELCDEYGILVMSEANLETHGIAKRVPGKDPDWAAHCVWRMENMVRTLRSHPSVILWSLGNESDMSDCFVQMQQRAVQLDPTRPVHYEGDTRFKATDIYSQMYVSPAHLERIGQGKPVFLSRISYHSLGRPALGWQYGRRPYLLCEYAHCMGNSLGNFAEYWDIFWKYDRLCGGFIWDFADQALAQGNRWCCGGDFGDEPNDGHFCCNGIFGPDRTPNPALFEVRQVLSPFVLRVEQGQAQVISRMAHATVSTLSVEWKLCENGVAIERGTEPVGTLAPGESALVALPYVGRSGQSCVDLVCTLVDTAPSPFAAAGRQLCSGWCRLQEAPSLPEPEAYAAPGKRHRKQYPLTAGDVTVAVSAKTGQLVSWEKAGRPLLSSPITPILARAVTDNDSYLGLPKLLRRRKAPGFWLAAAASLRVVSVAADETGVSVQWRAKGMKTLTARWQLGQDGSLWATLTGVPRRTDCPRIGLLLGAAQNLRAVRWFGLGPQENYPDRLSAACPGSYGCPAEQFGHDYVYPQENGCRQGVWSLELSGPMGAITAQAVDRPFAATVHTYPLGALQAASHAGELDRSGPAQLYLDAAVRGVGGDLPAIACTKPAYTLQKGTAYTLHVCLSARLTE